MSLKAHLSCAFLRKGENCMDIMEWKNRANIALVLGSGLNETIQEMMEIEEEILFSDIPGMKMATAPGHVGKFLLGTVQNVPVIALQGRLHYYEGHSVQDIVLPVKIFDSLGIKTLIVTNASGGINLSYHAGDFMLIEDHINFMGVNPLVGPKQEGLDRFPDMTFTYDREYIALFKKIAEKYSAIVHSGVYIGVSGPNYETPAEIRAFRALGADAVGMSTVPEVLAARQRNMRICGVSLISNMAAGVLDQKLTEEEVLEAGRQAQPVFKGMISDFIREIGG